MNTLIRSLLACCGLLLGTGPTYAALLNVSLDKPLTFADSNGHTDFNAANGTLSIRASLLNTDFGSGPLPSSGTLSIDIILNSSGSVVGGILGDDFKMVGIITDGTNTFTGTLLEGEILQFGFADLGPTTDFFDFRFKVTGGTMASLYAGKDIGVTLAMETDAAHSFTGSFTSNFSGNAKTFVGPTGGVGKTFTIGPSSMEGHLQIMPGDWISGGYSFKFVKSSHLATQFTVTSAVTLNVTCPFGGGLGGTIIVDLGTKTYTVPAGNTQWLPTGDANSVLSWAGAAQAPGLCGANKMDNSAGAIFTATVSQSPPSGSLVDFRFKYRDPNAKGKGNVNCLDTTDPRRNKADVCGASWSETVRDP